VPKGTSVLPDVDMEGPADHVPRPAALSLNQAAQRDLTPVLAGERSRYEQERQLWEARAQDPSHLPVYFSLYKFYASANRSGDAIRVLRLALTEAARQGGFHPDWERLNMDSQPVDLRATKAGRFYLFTLKVLAETKLQQEPNAEARSLLAHVRRLSRGSERFEAQRSTPHQRMGDHG
jgi:hypothetical protein